MEMGPSPVLDVMARSISTLTMPRPFLDVTVAVAVPAIRNTPFQTCYSGQWSCGLGCPLMSDCIRRLAQGAQDVDGGGDADENKNDQFEGAHGYLLSGVLLVEPEATAGPEPAHAVEGDAVVRVARVDEGPRRVAGPRDARHLRLLVAVVLLEADEPVVALDPDGPGDGRRGDRDGEDGVAHGGVDAPAADTDLEDGVELAEVVAPVRPRVAERGVRGRDVQFRAVRGRADLEAVRAEAGGDDVVRGADGQASAAAVRVVDGDAVADGQAVPGVVEEVVRADGLARAGRLGGHVDLDRLRAVDARVLADEGRLPRDGEALPVVAAQRVPQGHVLERARHRLDL